MKRKETQSSWGGWGPSAQPQRPLSVAMCPPLGKSQVDGLGSQEESDSGPQQP